MNLLEKGQRLLLRLLMKDASLAGPVTYTRLPVDGAGFESDLTGRVLGRLDRLFPPTDRRRPGHRLRGPRHLVPVAVLGAPPQRGDRFTQTVNGTELVFEVMSMLDEPERRYADPGKTIYRIHTKQA